MAASEAALSARFQEYANHNGAAGCGPNWRCSELCSRLTKAAYVTCHDHGSMLPLMDTIRPLGLELDIIWNSCNYLCEPNMMAHMTSLSVTNLYLWNFPNLPWDVMAQVHVQHTFRAVSLLPQLVDKVPMCPHIDITAPEAVIHFACRFRHASHVVLTECGSLQSFRTSPARSCWNFDVHTGSMRLAADFQALQPE